MSLQFNSPYYTMLDADGQIVVGGKAYFYETGGTFTSEKDVYSDSGLTTPIAQPVVTDAAGRLPRIFMSGQYDVRLAYSDDSTLATYEDYDPGLSAALGSGAALPVDQGGTGATSAPAALTNLGAASQAQMNSVASTTSSNNQKIATGLNEDDPTRFGNLASLDQIDNTDLVEADTLKLMNPFGLQLFHVRDEKASGTDGGTFSSGDWRTRTLNTVKTNEISGASLATDQITLPAGTYFIEASAPANSSSAFHKAKLRNVSDSTDTIIGTNGRHRPADGTATTTLSIVRGRFTIDAQKTFELQHQINSTQNTTGFGASCSFGVVEVYAEVLIWKVA